MQLFVISHVLSGKCQAHVILGTQQMCGGDNHSLQTKHPIGTYRRLVVQSAYITWSPENISYFICNYIFNLIS